MSLFGEEWIGQELPMMASTGGAGGEDGGDGLIHVGTVHPWPE